MLDLSRQTEALALRLAAEQDQSVDDIVRVALETCFKSSREQRVDPDVQATRRAALNSAIAAIAELPELDGRSSKAIMDDLDSL